MGVSHFVRSHVRLVNVGFIKSVSPILNFELIEEEGTLRPELDKGYNKVNVNSKLSENENKKNNKLGLNQSTTR
jgi:hypothetical protein